MANEVQKAQFALMAALDPEQFIEMAVQQGFRPEDLAKSTGLPPPQKSDFTNQSTAFKNRADTQNTVMGAPPPTGTMSAPPASPPQEPALPPPTGMSPSLQVMMGLAPQGTGAPPPAGVGMPALPGGDPFSQAVARQRWENSNPPGMTGAIQPPQAVMGAPPLGTLPPMATPPVMGNPGEVSPQAMAAINSMVAPAPPPPAAVAPEQGMFVDPATAAMATDPSALTGAPSQLASPGAFATMGNQVRGLFPPGLLPETPFAVAAGVPTPPAAGQNISQFDLMSGVIPPPPNAGVGGGALAATPPAAAVPPPGSPATEKVPVSKAGIKTVDSKVKVDEAAAKKDAKSTYDALAAVGGSMSKRGSGSDRAPGGAGVRGGQIQGGEITELLLKMLQPAQYSPGFIPYGKLF